MNTTRRTFLKRSAVLAASLPFARLGLEGVETPAAPLAPLPAGARRGLLFDDTDLPRIRANARHPRFAALWQSLHEADLAADRDFLANKVRLNNHVVDLLKVQKIMERACVLYAVEGDPAQLALARTAIRKMLEYPEWDSFIEGGRQIFGLQRAPEGSIALLLALDWLKGALTPEEVAAIEDAVATKGAPACATAIYGMKYPDRVQGWDWNPRSDVQDFRHINLKRWPLILNSTNLKIIPTAALGLIACHFHGRRPEAAGWQDLARSCARAFATIYGSDGSYDEGVSYWGYTTLHLALFAEALWRTQGIDDRALIDYPGTARYALGMTMPTLPSDHAVANFQHVEGFMMPLLKPEFDIVNFGDANGAVDVSVAAWIGRTKRDPLAGFVARDIGEARYLYGLIWYEPEAPVAPPEPALLDQRLANDLVLSRTGWTARDNVLALRSGGPANHEHADRNSVLFKAYGERLLHDPTRAAYVAHQPRWILRLTPAHTAVLINGEGHQYHDGHEGTNASWAFARVVAYATGPGWMTVSSDATDAYQLVNRQVARVVRTLVYLKPDVVIFLDRVTLSDGKASVQVRFQANNEDLAATLSLPGDNFLIARPRASLLGRVARTPGLVVRLGQLPLAEKDGSQPFAEVESAAAADHEILTVCTALPVNPAERGVLGKNTGLAAAGHGASAHGELRLSREGSVWRVQGTHAAQRINVSLDTADALPAITIT
ncbi:MAG: heparinase II/III family protein [Lacunisphaera sp.]|nr:heparinase II/III family protein [Lacunisphaera sp.]